jgi:putative hydrolase of HD superfamily
MEPAELLGILHLSERLKDAARHCVTSGGRQESVAEHSWRLALSALFLRDEFPQADMDRVIRMCLIHDLGECFTGDIPTFQKTDADRAREGALLEQWVQTLPPPYREELAALYEEMERRETVEAKVYKALDCMEAVIQHNESPLSSWSENEYALNLVHGFDKAAFSPYLTRLRQAVRQETEEKLRREGDL